MSDFVERLTSSATIVSEGFGCHHCDFFPLVGKPSLEVSSIKRQKDGFQVKGKVQFRHCRICGKALHEINKEVPIHLKDLVCQCGKNNFRFVLNSVKPNRAENATDWNFDLDVICRAGGKKTLTQKIAEFAKLKRIKVGPSGVDLTLK
jgi:hypothetical protein